MIAVGATEGRALAEEKIELSLTESFAKHKRNLLFVCSIVLVLAAASPNMVKIPGLSTGTGIDPIEGIPTSLAYFLLGCTLVYLFLSYGVELLAARALNLDGVARDGIGTVNDRIVASVQPVGERYGQMFIDMDNIKIVLNEANSQISSSNLFEFLEEMSGKFEEISLSMSDFPMPYDLSVASNVQSLRDQVIIVREDVRSLHNTMSQYEAHASSVSSSFVSFKQAWDKKSKVLSRTIDDLNGKLNRISGNISRSQRFGFAALEQIVPISLFALAFVACVDGAFLQSRAIDWIRGNIPAVDQLQAQQDAMPKVGTQSTENR
jgi:hypothetical protein